MSEFVDNIKTYYGETLQSQDDLKTTACCNPDAMPDRHKTILSMIDDEVLKRFYGCGSPIPPLLEGLTILDLGCGTGRDVYLLSKLVGPKGRVIGVDMTEEQLAVAKQALEGQMERFGFSESNVEFHHGRMEDLKSLGIEDGSIDVVVSNCVINLSDDKAKVFSEIYRVLKPGGELFFSDVFSDRRLSEAAQQDKVAVGECLGGALYQEDFRRLMENVGFLDPRVLIQSPIDVKDDSIVKLVGQTRFTSMTVRSFKLPQSMEDRCEDYGQVATYLGGIEDAEFVFSLDDHHHFEKNRPMLVCGNTAAMVQETRFSSYFRVNGDRKEHFGLFDCAPSSAQTSAQGEGAPSGACC